MKIVVSENIPVNPHIIRTSVYIYNGSIDNNDVEDYILYELAIPIEEYTEDDGQGNVSIYGDKYQEAITKRIVAANKTGNIAVYLDSLNLRWDVIASERTAVDTAVDNTTTKLAYGSE